MEPTLQAALLPKSTFQLVLEVSAKFDDYKLKDMKMDKPSRSKTFRQLTQNQVSNSYDYSLGH